MCLCPVPSSLPFPVKRTAKLEVFPRFPDGVHGKFPDGLFKAVADVELEFVVDVEDLGKGLGQFKGEGGGKYH
jgi:hypothetical protein